MSSQRDLLREYLNWISLERRRVARELGLDASRETIDLDGPAWDWHARHEGDDVAHRARLVLSAIGYDLGVEHAAGYRYRLHDLEGLSLDQMVVLFDAFSTAHDALLFVESQGRTNEAMDLIEEEVSRFSNEMGHIARTARARPIESAQDRLRRGEILVRWGLASDDWRGIAAAAAEHFGEAA